MKKVIVLCTAATVFVIASCTNQTAEETPVATTDTTVVADSVCCDTVATATAVTGAVDSPAVVK